MKQAPTASALLLALAVGLTACTSASTSTPPPDHNAPSSTVYRFGVVGNQGKIAQLELSTPAAVSGITGDVVQIATSNSDSYALTSDGEVWAWGVASYGELGDGQTAPYSTRAVRVDFPAGIPAPLGGRRLRSQALAAQALYQFLLPGIDRRQRPDHPAEQEIGQAGIADQRGAVQIGADHPAGIGALRTVPVADTGQHGGERFDLRAAPGPALMVLEAG